MFTTTSQIGQGETSKAWSTIGSLARTAQYLHLSVEDTDFAEPAALLSNLPRLPPPENWIEEEERRRLFWNVFLLDRYGPFPRTSCWFRECIVL